MQELKETENLFSFHKLISVYRNKPQFFHRISANLWFKKTKFHEYTKRSKRMRGPCCTIYRIYDNGRTEAAM